MLLVIFLIGLHVCWHGAALLFTTLCFSLRNTLLVRLHSENASRCVDAVESSLIPNYLFIYFTCFDFSAVLRDDRPSPLNYSAVFVRLCCKPSVSLERERGV